MSIRLSLYDFFAFTIPGVFYLLVAGFALVSFGFVNIDWQSIGDLPLTLILVFVGAGYVCGNLLDVLAFQLSKRFYDSNSAQRVRALNKFQDRHPWLQPEFVAADWDVLLRVLQLTSMEPALDIERHNVASIMLRNIGLGLLFLALVFTAYYFLVSAYIWNLALAALFLALSGLAFRRNAQRRFWFYHAIYEAIAARQLQNHNWISLKNEPETVAERATIFVEDTSTN